MPFVFATGFDNEVYFEQGNWKRLKDIMDPPPEFPFDFLKGQKPVQQSHDRRHLGYSYAFQADFTKTRKTVEDELLSKGFKITNDDPRGFGRKWRSVEYERGENQVIIYEHMRYMKPKSANSRYSILGHDIEGWVSFQVRLERTTGSRPQKTVSDRR